MFDCVVDDELNNSDLEEGVESNLKAELRKFEDSKAANCKDVVNEQFIFWESEILWREAESEEKEFDREFVFCVEIEDRDDIFCVDVDGSFPMATISSSIVSSISGGVESVCIWLRRLKLGIWLIIFEDVVVVVVEIVEFELLSFQEVEFVFVKDNVFVSSDLSVIEVNIDVVFVSSFSFVVVVVVVESTVPGWEDFCCSKSFKLSTVLL